MSKKFVFPEGINPPTKELVKLYHSNEKGKWAAIAQYRRLYDLEKYGLDWIFYIFERNSINSRPENSGGFPEGRDA